MGHLMHLYNARCVIHKVFSSKGISIISNVVPGNLDVVTTSFSPTLCSINLLIKVDLPTFVVPTI